MSEFALSPSNVVIAVADTGKVIGTATNFVVNIDRRKLPILALGTTEPIGYGKGFRIISGMIDYVQLKQDLLIEILKAFKNSDTDTTYTVDPTVYDVAHTNISESIESLLGVDIGDANADITISDVGYNLYKTTPYTLDMIPAFDVIVYGISEEGESTYMKINGLEFASSSMVMTINDVAVAQRAEWIARSVTPWMPTN